MAGMLAKLLPELKRVGMEVHKYRTSPIGTVKRYLDLYRRRRFSPDEIHFFRLLDPRLTNDDLRSVVSKEELLTVQRRLNPVADHPLTEDKIQFQLHCEHYGIEVPRIFAVVSDREAVPDRLAVHPVRALPSILDALPADVCIVKPVHGLHGEGVLRLTRRDGAWFDQHFRRLDSRSLQEAFERSRYRAWMFQALVESCSELCELSNTEALQTVRVVTLTRLDGTVEIIAARIRLICSDVAYDNFNYGKTGNVIANLDTARGAIVSVVGSTGKDPQICYVDRHPKTGRSLIGFVVPQWSAVRQLAMRAAKAFLPLRTVGWDIAVTPTGPCLIEGNVTWDTLSGEKRMGEIYRYLDGLEI